jgi:uncharacterized protein YdaU (DUF1376 family)
MSGLPWFKFYHQDWRAGTAKLTSSEKGVYIDLLAAMYDEGGSIERDDAGWARVCGLPKAGFVRALKALIKDKKIIEVDGRLSNGRVEKELCASQNARSVKSQNAKSRWQKTEENQSSENASAMRPHTEVRSQKSEDITNVISKRAPRAADEVKKVLLTVLPEDVADAVIAHRKAKKSPLTTPAMAQMLLKKFQQWHDPVEAATEMISRGWQGFNPDWMARAGPRPAPPSQSRGIASRLLNEIYRKEREDGQSQSPAQVVELIPFERHDVG